MFVRAYKLSALLSIAETHKRWVFQWMKSRRAWTNHTRIIESRIKEYGLAGIDLSSTCRRSRRGPHVDPQRPLRRRHYSRKVSHFYDARRRSLVQDIRFIALAITFSGATCTRTRLCQIIFRRPLKCDITVGLSLNSDFEEKKKMFSEYRHRRQK